MEEEKKKCFCSKQYNSMWTLSFVLWETTVYQFVIIYCMNKLFFISNCTASIVVFAVPQRQSEATVEEGKKGSWINHLPSRGILFQVVKIPMFCEGACLYFTEVLTGEANRHFMFAVKNNFITTVSHQLNLLLLQS